MLSSAASAVRHRTAARLTAAAPATRACETLVIIGNGMVGHRLCRRLVELGATRRFRIVVFGEEPEPAYDRVHLTELFECRTEDDLWLAPANWYEDHDIELYLGDPVVEIDRQARTVRSARGLEIGFSHAVIATGSSPHVPPIAGVELSRIFVYRTVRDVRSIQEHARAARTAAVIGGGLLGLEAVRALHRLGLEVTMVESAAALMPTQLDQPAGEELQRHVAALGVRVLTATMTQRIEAAGRRRTLHFAAGGSITVDMVVVAAGVRPRSQLAAACDLARSVDGGIIVDDALRTSDPRICAIGECASHRSRLYGLVAPGYAMADTLALNLIGRSRRFAGFSPTVRLKLLEADVASAGEPLEAGTVLRFRDAGIYRRVRLERGRLVGALGVGTWAEFSRIQDAIARRRRVWPWELGRFERTGVLWRSQSTPAVTQWPAEAVVCNCLGITRGQIAAACSSGAATVDAVIERTGASTLCGSCRPVLTYALGAVDPAGTRIAWGLLGVSMMAVAIAVAVVTTAPIPYVTTVNEPVQLDVLWRDETLHRITGFSLLGLTLAAALLPLRKRWRRVSFGRFPVWRVAHAAIGLATLATLAAHTGMRVGHNLNFALMASFIALNVLGALAGGVASLEPRMGGGAGRHRAALVTAHILATWPLPMLIAFHVASTYYF